MNVALLISGFHPTVGGAERQALLLARALSDHHGAKITVVTRGVPGLPRHDEAFGLSIVRSPSTLRSRWLDSAAFLATSLPTLALHRPRFDVYHCVQSYSPATLGALAAHARGGRVVVKVTASNQLGEAAELRRLPFFRLRMRLLGRVDAFVALTDQIEAELVELGIDPARIARIPNGVELPNLDGDPATQAAMTALRTRLGLPASGPVVAYTGRLSAEKGLEVLVEAWRGVQAAHPDARLLLVGPPSHVRNVEPDLRAACERHGLHSVVFVGAVEDVSPCLRLADIFTLPSRSEGLSNALLEGMAHGCAVVTTDIDGNRHVVEHGESALKVPPGDADALGAAILRLLGDAMLRAKLGAGARRACEERYSIESVASRYAVLYRGASPREASRLVAAPVANQSANDSGNQSGGGTANPSANPVVQRIDEPRA